MLLNARHRGKRLFCVLLCDRKNKNREASYHSLHHLRAMNTSGDEQPVFSAPATPQHEHSTPMSTPASSFTHATPLDGDEPLRHEMRAMKRRMRELDKRLQALEQFCERHESTMLQLKQFLDKQTLHEAREQNLALRRHLPVPFFSHNNASTRSTFSHLAPPLNNVFPGGFPISRVYSATRGAVCAAESKNTNTLAL